ncbi:Uncharacterised protein [Escherichia coli]|nr:Uncharacterised protein [Escherichia coli]
MTVHRIFYGDVRRGSVPVAPVNRCPLAINVQKPARTAHEAGSAGSGHDFRGVCFSVAYTTPNGKSCRTFPKTRSIYHNSRCTYHVKRPQSLSGAKNAKRQENTRPNQKKRVRIVFRALHNYARKRCAIGFVRSEHRTAQTTSFLSLNGAFYTEIFVPLSIILITGFPS